MSKVNVRTADQPLRRLLLPAAFGLSAAFVVGAAGAVQAQLLALHVYTGSGPDGGGASGTPSTMSTSEGITEPANSA